MSDTLPEAPAAERGPAGCPVAHEQTPRCPVAGRDSPGGQTAGTGGRTTVCGYAGGAKRGYFIPGMIALLVLLVGGGIFNAAALSHSGPTHLDGSTVDAQIADNYQSNHHLESPPPVRCPDNEAVAAGHRFTCQLLRTGATPLVVAVTETGGTQIAYQVLGGS